ncbi:protein FAM110B-like [Gigantopelta aegis]|uniref:protein FAM110B-like n=1 Tax=Gigantopelta aegis TaxID=1735272 RepID=UPI001B88768D|nr:protein FAM110B-like [Gigantopelta aegis]
MSLLVASSTMGGSPSRLLDKGPSYLRKQRTNARLFAHRRRSAVELLEASKPQYLRGNTDSDPQHHGSSDDLSRLQSIITKQPLRSKSEYDLSQIQQGLLDGGEKEYVEATRRISQNTSSSSRVGISKSKMSENNSEKASFPSNEKSSHIEADSEKPLTTNTYKLHHDVPLPSWSSQTHTEMIQTRIHSMQNNSSNDLSARFSRDEFFMQNTGVLVHRSHSAINCRHARNGSDSSDYIPHYSRASADLEIFFSQMGLEKNVLDPMLRQQEAHKKHGLFESVSSLDSPDTRSICSDYVKSDAGLSDLQADADKSVIPTSAVERNARIIKWLCSVKKAKTLSKSQT